MQLDRNKPQAARVLGSKPPLRSCEWRLPVLPSRLVWPGKEVSPHLHHYIIVVLSSMAAFCYCLRTPYNHVRAFLSRGWSGVWKELRFAASLEMSLSFSTSFSEPQPLEWNREDEVSPQACSEDVLRWCTYVHDVQYSAWDTRAQWGWTMSRNVCIGNGLISLIFEVRFSPLRLVKYPQVVYEQRTLKENVWIEKYKAIKHILHPASNSVQLLVTH